MAKNGAEESADRPVVLICGTPGTGKSKLAEAIASTTSCAHMDVGNEVRQVGLFDEYDEDLDTHLVDDSTVISHLKPHMRHHHRHEPDGSHALHLVTQVVGSLEDTIQHGNLVLDYHSCDLFPPECVTTHQKYHLL